MGRSHRFVSDDFKPEDFSGFVRGRPAGYRIHQHVDEIRRVSSYENRETILKIRWEEENPLPDLEGEVSPELKEKLRKIFSK